MAPDVLDQRQSPIPIDHHPAADSHPSSNQALLTTLERSSHNFLQPPPSLHAASLSVAKSYLDPLANSTSDVQIQRQQRSRRKRKRGDFDDYGSDKPLRLRRIHLEGFRIDQIWEQARRVLDASRREVQRSLPAILQEQRLSENATENQQKKGQDVRFENLDQDDLHADDLDAQEIGLKEDDSMEDADGLLEEYEGSETDDGEELYDDEGDMLEEEGVALGSDEDGLEASDLGEESKATFVPDKLGLNDGFFSIDDFNRQSEFLEQQDARGDNDGAASDEEDIDWDADPLAKTSSRKKDRDVEDEVGEESEDAEDGPTFGDADINGLYTSDSEDSSHKEVQMENIGSMNNTNDIKYADFFEPPPRKASKPSRHRALPKTQPPPSASALKQETEDDLQRTISAVRRDIFEDDLTPDEDEAESNANDPRSSHQKRQAALTAEIRRLEAAAVAKRDWTLSGEARAVDRPINSLLEEDLEFERAGKPIPIITQEVSEDIEALIRRRILAREFDEVIRRRPGSLATGGADVRRGRFELEDTKPQQSLAEMYEVDHLRNIDPENYTSKADEKLKREHAKIEAMWKDISAKLDALSGWHYKPKPPSASINIVADVPIISMEDARPAGGGDVVAESMLAPQEVYKAGEARDKKSEVVTGGGLPVGREEMTREEKLRRRRREKERIRKAGGVVPSAKGGALVSKGGKEVGKKAKERQSVIGDLKKGGVRVIGKKGEIRDVEGQVVKAQVGAGKGGGGFKL